VGAPNGVLILAAQRRRDFRIVLAQAVEREVRRDLALTVEALPPDQQARIIGGFESWLARASIERCPLPSEADILSRCAHLMPALQHDNDIAAVVSALLSQPDWVLSTNTKHWNAELARRSRLRIATPQRFVEQLQLVTTQES
jgi:hypothetical protein